MKNHQIYQNFNFRQIVLFEHLKMFCQLFFSWLSANPIYFLTTEAIRLKCRHGVYNYVLCAMTIFCYLSITVGYMFYHISAYSSIMDNYMITYLLYFIINALFRFLTHLIALTLIL